MDAVCHQESETLRAFISYHHDDRRTAGRISEVLEEYDVITFMAHDDINVSEEWRQAILQELGQTDFFLAVLSERYQTSHWCTQEAGIAAFRGLTCIPLSIDGTIPPGFMQHVQAARLDPDNVNLISLLPGLIKHDEEWAIDILVDYVSAARGFRTAEDRFRALLPYRNRMTEEQGLNLLEACIENGQIHDASECARDHLPLILEQFGQALDDDKFKFLLEQVNDYRGHGNKKEWQPTWLPK